MARTTVAKKQLASMADYAALEFGAAITEKKMEEIERVAQDCEFVRRIGFAVLARTKAQLMESGDDKTLGKMFDWLSDYITNLKAQVKVMQAAQARIMSAGATLVVQADKKAGRHRRNRIHVDKEDHHV